MTAFESPTFTLLSFLRDRALAIFVCVGVLVFETLVLVVLRVSSDAIVLVDGVQLTALVLVLLVEYLRRARFYRQLETLTRAIDHATHFIDLVEEPSFSEGRAAREAAQSIALLASDEITELKAQTLENGNYIELWVHEIKTPIAALKLLVNGMHGPDAEKLRYETERIEHLVNQALFTARSTSLANDYAIREIGLAEVVGEACKQNMQYLTSLGITLDMRIDPELTVFADKSWLSFILSQVIINSAKYDARTISFSAQQSAREGSDARTVLEMRDDGCGIPAADVPRVFDRGFTGEVGRAHGSATGMGLYLAARLCARMGLSITLTSEEGVGTRVRIGFPHDRGRLDAAAAGAAPDPYNNVSDA